MSCTLRASALAYSSDRVSPPPTSLPATIANRRRPWARAVDAVAATASSASNANLGTTRTLPSLRLGERPHELLSRQIQAGHAAQFAARLLVGGARGPNRSLDVDRLIRQHDDDAFRARAVQLPAAGQVARRLLGGVGQRQALALLGRQRLHGAVVVDGQRDQIAVVAGLVADAQALAARQRLRGIDARAALAVDARDAHDDPGAALGAVGRLLD